MKRVYFEDEENKKRRRRRQRQRQHVDYVEWVEWNDTMKIAHGTDQPKILIFFLFSLFLFFSWILLLSNTIHKRQKYYYFVAELLYAYL